MSHRYVAARRIIRRGGVCAASLVLSLAMTSTTLAAPAEGAPFELLASPGNQTISSVTMAAPDDGWVVGDQGSGANQRPYAAHWDGGELKEKSLGDLADKPIALNAVTAIDSDDVWATGMPLPPIKITDGERGPRPGSSLPIRDHRGKTRAPSSAEGSPRAAGKPYVMTHWDGKAWKQSKVPPPAEGLQGTAIGIQAFGPDDVWVAGYDSDPDATSAGGKAFVDHFDGKEWKRLPLPKELTSVESRIYDIAGNGSDDLWVAGSLPTEKKDTPFVAHWDGKKFTVTKLPVTGDFPNGWNANVIATFGENVYVTGKSLYTERVLTTAYQLVDGKWVEWKDTGLAEFNDTSVNPKNGHLLAGGWPSLDANTSGYGTFDGKTWTLHAQPDKLPKGGGQVLSVDHEKSSGRGFGVGYISPADGSTSVSFLTSDTK